METMKLTPVQPLESETFTIPNRNHRFDMLHGTTMRLSAWLAQGLRTSAIRFLREPVFVSTSFSSAASTQFVMRVIPTDIPTIKYWDAGAIGRDLLN